jgi:hypothetical protein
MSFYCMPAQGYFVGPAPAGARGEYEHVLCGLEQRNVCPNCDKPLLRVMTLDTRDQRLCCTHVPVDRLSLYFCWRCNVAQAPFYYRLLTRGRIEILMYGRGGVEEGFPFSNYPLGFPECAVTLAAMPSSVQERLIRINEGLISDAQWARPRHQVGGVPFLFQYSGMLALKCAVCHNVMPFLATICDDTGTGQSFTGNRSVQMVFHFCRRCVVVLGYQECD